MTSNIKNKSIEKEEESRSCSTLYLRDDIVKIYTYELMLIFEDDIKFLRSKEQTFKIIEKVFHRELDDTMRREGVFRRILIGPGSRKPWRA